MIITVTTCVLAAAMAAFAFYAVLLNEAGHAARRRVSVSGAEGPPAALDLTARRR